MKKDVVYFAARFQSGSPEAQPEEVMDIVWASPDKALQLVTYQNDVETLEAFLDYEKTSLIKKIQQKVLLQTLSAEGLFC